MCCTPQVTATQEFILKKTLTFCTNREISIRLTTTRASVIHPLPTLKRSLIWIRSFHSLHNPTPVILKADLLTISFPTLYWMKINKITFQKLLNTPIEISKRGKVAYKFVTNGCLKYSLQHMRVSTSGRFTFALLSMAPIILWKPCSYLFCFFHFLMGMVI